MPYTGRKMTGRKKMQERMSAKKKDAKKKAVPKAKPTAKVLGPKKKATITGKGGRNVGKKANVTKEQLAASGLSLRAYLNEYDKTGKRPTAKKATDREAISKVYGKEKTSAVYGKKKDAKKKAVPKAKPTAKVLGPKKKAVPKAKPTAKVLGPKKKTVKSTGGKVNGKGTNATMSYTSGGKKTTEKKKSKLDDSRTPKITSGKGPVERSNLKDHITKKGKHAASGTINRGKPTRRLASLRTKK